MAGEKFCVDCKYCLELPGYCCIRKVGPRVEPRVDLVTGYIYYSRAKFCYTLRNSQNARDCGKIGRYFEPKDL